MRYTKEQYYQDIKKHLIGSSIEEVYYEVLNNYDESDTYEHWELSENIHSIEMNIIFKLDNGRLVQIFWDNNFDCYGIGLEVLKDFTERESFKLINVSDNDNISKIIGSKINDVIVSWDSGPTPLGTEEEADIPLVWQILLEVPVNMWVAAFELRDKNYPLYFMDHLTVFFDITKIERYKLLDCENIVSVNTITK